MPPPEEESAPATPTQSVLTKAASNKDLNENNPLHLGSMNPPEWTETPYAEPYTIRGKTYLEDNIKYKVYTFVLRLSGR